MNRRNILKTGGLAAVASLLPIGKSRSANAAVARLQKEILLPTEGCILIPQETAGPYPWPSNGKTLSAEAIFYRQDITEGGAGIPFQLTLNILNTNDNCAPVQNAAVVIWHCDLGGNYSEFGNSVGKTFYRGIQMTDVNGQVTFKTSYPSWYPGRTTHIHFQVFLNSVLSATSQMAFNETVTSQVYSAAPYSTRGQKDTSNASDNVFSDTANTAYELVTPIGNPTDGYTATFTAGIAAPKAGVINLEPETGGEFELGQNYPNPVSSATTIPFTLFNPANVLLEIFDVNGNKTRQVINSRFEAGEQQAVIKKQDSDSTLASGGYIYQLTVESAKGTFRQCKMMTIL